MLSLAFLGQLNARWPPEAEVYHVNQACKGHRLSCSFESVLIPEKMSVSNLKLRYTHVNRSCNRHGFS